jgi:hypothetical protein
LRCHCCWCSGPTAAMSGEQSQLYRHSAAYERLQSSSSIRFAYIHIIAAVAQRACRHFVLLSQSEQLLLTIPTLAHGLCMQLVGGT